MPLTLYDTPKGISLRLLTSQDTEAYLALIQITRLPYQAVEPIRDDEFYTLHAQTRRIQDRMQAAEEGTGYQFGIFTIDDGVLIGQVSLNNVVQGVANYADLLIKQPDTKDEVKLAFTGSNTYTKINEKPAFKINIPTGEDVITMDEFEELMNASYGY